MRKLERKEKIILISSLGLVTFLILVSMIGTMLWKREENKKGISEVEQILMNAAGNLSGSVNSAGNREMDSALSLPVYYKMFQVDDTKYTRHTTKTSYGPSVDRCMGMVGLRYSDDDLISETRIYNNTEDNSYYYYSETKLANGEMIDLVIQTGGDTYYYSGGKYAVKVNDGINGGVVMYDTVEPNIEDNFPQDPELSESDTENGYEGEGSIPSEPETDPNGVLPEEEYVDSSMLQALFGIDAELVGESVYEGKEVYVIRAFTEGYCEPYIETKGFDTTSITNEGKTTKLANEYLITKDDYQIVNTKVFLSDFSEKNLIQAVSNNSEGSDVDFAQVQDQFKFNLEVEVRTVNYPTFDSRDEEIQAYMDHLAQKGLKVIAPVQDGFILSSAWSQELWTPEGYDYITDSDYYSNSAVGRQRFKDMTGDSELESDNGIITLDYGSSEKTGEEAMEWNYLNVSYFPESEYQAIVDRYTENNSVEQVKIKIDDQELSSVRIVYDNSGVAEPYSADDPAIEIMPMRDYVPTNEYVYIFKYQGVTITISSNLEQLEMRSLDLKNPDQKDILDQMILKDSEDFGSPDQPVAF